MPRFSIRQLLLATAFIAVGCFALLNASAWAAAALFCGVTLILSAAVLFAIYRDGERRAFWIGFAVLGWVYLFLCFSGFLSATSLSWHGNITALLTGAIYDRVYSSGPAQSVPYATSTITYSPYTPAGSSVPITFTPGMVAPMTGSVTYAVAAPARAGPDREQFLYVAHGLWTLLLATAGGWLAAWLHRTRPRVPLAPGQS